MSANPFEIFNDDLDAPAPAGAPMPSVAKAQAGEGFVETCPKCRGTGRFISYSGRNLGPCFACKGAGKNSYKSSPEDRQRNQRRAAAKRIEKAQSIEMQAKAWIAEHAAEAKWLADAGRRNIERGGSFTFPQDILNKLHQFGSLTDAQFAAVRKLMARDVEQKAKWDAERAAKQAAAPVADAAGVDRLKVAFDAAIAYSAAKGKGIRLRTPRITIGDVTIAPAPASGVNPGALYVKTTTDVYLGKISGGSFVGSRDCSAEDTKRVLAFVADPAQAAKVYGQETGICCVCNATLTSEWRLRGIGPICAEKFGWA